MRVWTIQNPAVLDDIDKGVYHADPRFIDSDYIDAYSWMEAQCPFGLSDGASLVWAWVRCDGGGKMSPQAIRDGLFEIDCGICIELDVPDEFVLVSQFEMWTWILNGKYIPINSRDYERNGGVSGKMEKMVSWGRIFDLSIGSAEFWKPPGERSLQAVLPSIRKEWVRDSFYL